MTMTMIIVNCVFYLYFPNRPKTWFRQNVAFIIIIIIIIIIISILQSSSLPDEWCMIDKENYGRRTLDNLSLYFTITTLVIFTDN